jgi:hypothetical protein
MLRPRRASTDLEAKRLATSSAPTSASWFSPRHRFQRSGIGTLLQAQAEATIEVIAKTLLVYIVLTRLFSIKLIQVTFFKVRRRLSVLYVARTFLVILIKQTILHSSM